MIHISQTQKIRAGSWSLEALLTCPAAIISGSLKSGKYELADACKGCYALGGNYRYPNVKAPRIANRQDWKRDDWVDDMVEELDSHRYFRWFDSGDCYDLRLAKKILAVMAATPYCRHWFPTRQHKFPKFMKVLRNMESLTNVAVRLSSDSVLGGILTTSLPNTTIIPTPEYLTPEMSLCNAWANDGKCGKCRDCWDSDIKTVAYVAHGQTMAKVIKIKLLEVA